MRFIGRKFHAVLDYIAGLFLISAPWLFGFASLQRRLGYSALPTSFMGSI